MEPVTLADIRLHLNLGDGSAAENAYLEALLVAARRRVEIETNRTIIGLHEIRGDDLIVVGHAIRLIVGHWYANREASVEGKALAGLPMGVSWLLDPLRKWATD